MSTEPSRVVVRRRLLVWRPRLRRLDGSGGLDVVGAAIGEGFLVGLALVAIALVLVFTLPFLVLAVEVAILVSLTMLAVFGRLVLRHPWPVEAVDTATGERVGRWDVVGWRHAGQVRDELAALAAFGGELPPDGPYVAHHGAQDAQDAAGGHDRAT